MANTILTAEEVAAIAKQAVDTFDEDLHALARSHERLRRLLETAPGATVYTPSPWRRWAEKARRELNRAARNA